MAKPDGPDPPQVEDVEEQLELPFDPPLPYFPPPANNHPHV